MNRKSDAPLMYDMLKIAREYVADVLEAHEESSCLLDAELKPRDEFFRKEDAETAREMRTHLEMIDAAIFVAEFDDLSATSAEMDETLYTPLKTLATLREALAGAGDAKFLSIDTHVIGSLIADAHALNTILNAIKKAATILEDDELSKMTNNEPG